MRSVTIERLGLAGDGIAEGSIYVPRTLPGEVVEGDIAGSRIESPRILAPSPDRVSPPCPHYRSCGSCALQHASDTFVETWKADVVRRALLARGIEAEIAPVVTSPPRSRRRAKLAGRRTRGGVMVGFHGRASGTMTAIPGCLLLHTDLMAARPALEALAAIGASRKGEIALSVTGPRSAPMWRSTAPSPPAPPRWRRAAVSRRSTGSRLTWNGDLIAAIAPPAQAFGWSRVAPSPAGFLQATAEGEAALTAFVRGATRGAGRVVDHFAGAGTFSLTLAEGGEVHAVEAGWRGAPA